MLKENKNELKRNNRYMVNFDGIEISEFATQQIQLPNYLNGAWGEMKIIFNDEIEISTSEAIYKIINKKKWSFFRKPIFSFTIKTFNSVGECIEKWKVVVKKIKYVEFGYYIINADQIKNVKMIIKPLNCKLL